MSNYQQYILDAAKQLGMNPLDLATIISYETAGTFSPTIKGGVRTKWGDHRGWLQWGEPQAKQYGVDFSNPETQGQAIVRYFNDRGWKPNMGTLDAYSIVNAGQPGKYNAVDLGTTVADKVAGFGPHRAKAEKWLGHRYAPVSDDNPAELPPPPEGYEYSDEPEPRSPGFKIEVTPDADLERYQDLQGATINPTMAPPAKRLMPALASFFNDVGRINSPKTYDPLTSVRAPAPAPYDPLSSVKTPPVVAQSAVPAAAPAPAPGGYWNRMKNSRGFQNLTMDEQRRLLSPQPVGMASLFG